MNKNEVKLNFSQTATAYKIYKDNIFTGYLIGSMHYNFNPQEYEDIKTKLEPAIKECSTIFLECNLPHSTQLPFGYEKATKELLETKFTDKTNANFEPLILQQAILQCSLWVGITIKHLPWLNYRTLSSAPTFFYYLSVFTAKPCLWYNQIYNILYNNAHSTAVRELAVESQKQALKIYQNFTKNIASPLTNLNNKMFLMSDRNKAYANKIKLQPLNIKTCFIVGASHLPSTLNEDGTSTNDGMVHLLEKAGYKLEATSL